MHTGTTNFAAFLTVPAALDGVAGGHCVRVTPALYTMPAHVDRLAAALKAMV